MWKQIAMRMRQLRQKESGIKAEVQKKETKKYWAKYKSVYSEIAKEKRALNHSAIHLKGKVFNFLKSEAIKT
jgi:hypothetical protein